MVSESSAKLQEWRHNWPVVLAAASGMLVSSVCVYSFGVMLVPIQADLHWTRTEIASGPTLVTLVVFLTATLFGKLVDQFGSRWMGAAAVVIICGALALMALVQAHLWQWWACWALLGIGCAIIPAACLRPVSSRFDAGQGMAISVALCGSGITAICVPTLTNALVEHFGWRMAYTGLAAISCAFALPLVLLFLNEGAATEVRSTDERSDVVLPGFTVRQAFASRRLYHLLLAILVSTFFATALTLNLVPILRQVGFTPALAAGIVALLGVSTFGRIASGWLFDRVNAAVATAAASFAMALLPATLLLWPHSMPILIGSIIVYGFMSGALSAGFACLASRHFGPRSFGTVYGTINAILSIDIGLGPLMTSFLYDHAGSYRLTMVAAIPLFLAGAILFATLGPYPRIESVAADA